MVPSISRPSGSGVGFGRMRVARQVADVAEDPEDVSLVEGAEGLTVPAGRASDKLTIIGLLEVRPTHNPSPGLARLMFGCWPPAGVPASPSGGGVHTD